MLQLI